MKNKPEQKRIPDDVVVEIKMWRKFLLEDSKVRQDPVFMKWSMGAAEYLLSPPYQDHWKEIEAEHDCELGRK